VVRMMSVAAVRCRSVLLTQEVSAVG
jgi:hypothetical protein